ncbi:uncharacterized protein F4812DRAFT_293610 [Daldinia caldariorum]|uniref:uncharacterized protein n=1 Tax=Daldinia caldariorum TaxID=326644 RepID=UPI0020086DE4|nr:uncharacterized protein F4812DRAFT_293610 [Daldinia caldariorum]KAI1462931.1 hypothetical protein F4812DRAFT_293610 [Daldinia caldariorum]
MGANRKHMSKAPCSPGTIRSSGCVAQAASHTNGIPHHGGGIEPAVFRGFDTDFNLEDTPLVCPLSQQYMPWEDGGNGTVALRTGNLHGITGKVTETEPIDLSQGILIPCVSDIASSLTYSPSSSYQGSVLSSIQTDFASEIFSTGTSKSRAPSPLQLKERLSTGTDSHHICPRDMCRAKFSNKRDLETHYSIGHRHTCLWGDKGPCSSAGFATSEELNWHVKREHLLLCPVPGCAEDTFDSRDLLDCHLKYAHGNTTAARNASFKPVNLLETTKGSPAAPGVGCQSQMSINNLKAMEGETFRMKTAVDLSKSRCRDRLEAILKKQANKAKGKIRALNPSGMVANE